MPILVGYHRNAREFVLIVPIKIGTNRLFMFLVGLCNGCLRKLNVLHEIERLGPADGADADEALIGHRYGATPLAHQFGCISSQVERIAGRVVFATEEMDSYFLLARAVKVLRNLLNYGRARPRT